MDKTKEEIAILLNQLKKVNEKDYYTIKEFILNLSNIKKVKFIRNK